MDRLRQRGEPGSKCGQLNDGQNRCAAVVRSGLTVPTIFVFGLERETRLTVDQGVGKRPGDYLAMSGVANSNHVAAIAAMIWQCRLTFGAREA